MNGMFGNYYGFPATPQQNVAQYLRSMPSVAAAPKQQQYPTMQQFVSAFNQPQQQDASLNPLLHVAGYGNAAQQPQQPTQPTPAEQAILHISGGYNANKTV